MSVGIILATNDERAAQHLTDSLAEAPGLQLLQVAWSGDALIDTLARTPEAEIVIVDEALDDGHGLGVVRTIGASNPLIGLVLLTGSGNSPDAFAAAMEAGARSLISRTSSLAEIASRLESVSQWVTAARSAITADLAGLRESTVIAVAGGKGGVGASVLTLLLARGVAPQRSTCVVDLDLLAGDLGAYLGVHTRRSVVDLVDVAGEISGRVLRETSYDAPGGLRLITAPDESERAEEMTVPAARSIVTALRHQYDVAVIDVGSHLTEVSAAVLEDADVAVLVATPDLPALRAARRTLATWERLAIRQTSDVTFVLNRTSRQSQVTPQFAGRVVDLPVAATLPDGGAAFEAEMNTATIISAATATHAKAAKLAQALTAPRSDGSATGEADSAEPGRRRGRRARAEARLERTLESEKAAESIVATSRRSRVRSETGQASVELPAAIAIALFLFLACAQAIAWAAGFPLARNAAQEGARTMSLYSYSSAAVVAATADARDELSEPWRSQSHVTVLPSAVTVTVTAPTIVPGLSLTSSATASVLPEGS